MVLSMDRWVGKVAIVTGASSGIGAAISEELVKKGLQAVFILENTPGYTREFRIVHPDLTLAFQPLNALLQPMDQGTYNSGFTILEVVGAARRKERIEDLAKKLAGQKGKLFAMRVDMRKEEEILDMFKWIRGNLGPVHILINNAGLVQSGSLTDGDTDRWRNVLDVNVLGLCIATREAIKDMKNNNIDGHIVHINSIAGHKVPNIPAFNIYTASKFAVTALTESLRLELNLMKTKIKITSISPGATETEFLEVGKFESGGQTSKAFEIVLRAEDVADAILYALSTPPHVQVHELTIKPVNERF